MAESKFDRTYDPHSLEQRLYRMWEKGGYFAPSNVGPPYSIMIPPPNVTGSLHMGHAFQDTLMDALTRYHRMRGANTLWQAGTDHAGIATQMVVERMLEAEGKTRRDLGREAFIERVWQWKEQSGGTITQQLRRMGASLDWSRERFTMDADLSGAVTEVFVRLYDEGLIYRGKRLVNWDPVLLTAVSDLEVISEEEDGHLWYVRYPLTDASGYVVVATTRPETMLGDAAVAVHPEDERYGHLVGSLVRLPLAERNIPVIADNYVKREFGTGCLKITPAHDFNDYEVWQRHQDNTQLKQIPLQGLINIFTSDARIKASDLDDFTFGHRAPDARGTVHADTDIAGKATYELLPKSYRGLDRFKARAKIVDDLKAAGLIEKVEPYKLKVPRGDRTGAVIEPYLTGQWFVCAEPLAKPSIEAVEKGNIKFVPENWAKTYFEWMHNIQDWCISRQIWWGHRIPAWYNEAGNVFVGRDESEVRKKHQLGPDIQLTQDPDVLDTWFSSALWPFSTLGWPQQTPELNTFYPTSVLVTGFDIIFFWVARMIMMGLKFAGDVPFREVYVHGLVRDAHGDKMSKSKGNILDPLDLIDGIDLETLVEKRTTGLMQPAMAPKIAEATRKEFPHGIPAYGTDALRFTFASLATQGRGINFDTGRIQGNRNFCNKLWNAARYVLMNTEGHDCGLKNENFALTDADRWIVSRLQQVEDQVETAIRGYRFDLMAQVLYGFVWDEYCSWYLELSKVTLSDPSSSPEFMRGTRRTLVRVLETLLRLIHPIMPFITEEIWQSVAPLSGKQGDTIMTQPYPQAEPERIDQQATATVTWAMAVTTGVRNIRGEMDIAPGKRLRALLQPVDDSGHDGANADREHFERSSSYVVSLAGLETLDWLESGASVEASATSLVGNLKVFVPFGSLIDKQAEEQRLAKEKEKISENLDRARNKLANPDFVERAPDNVVEEERRRVTEFETALKEIDAQLEKIRGLDR
ncbi:MAG: valine--tRNA ligase [Acidiferrobacterales bacterium]